MTASVKVEAPGAKAKASARVGVDGESADLSCKLLVLSYTVGWVGAPGETGVGNRSISQASHLLFVGTSHLSVMLITQLQGNGSKKTAKKMIEDPMTTYSLL